MLIGVAARRCSAAAEPLANKSAPEALIGRERIALIEGERLHPNPKTNFAIS
ncbi:hypothetical protein KEU06_13135 [Pseudaminobacter sp. 19-2017]|uniref:Uncharacterized protein n=1 Tax=Pseudaminobacter soli (ex Zhang et al. 2022) TaxID=2831468 RepID=A0A942DX07_9HYPH|nr:hypothetical protein [Pseudaminobacter soli]MBS3649554.1 hypothetical protein [Pseudaminobacter soli]